MAKKFVRGITDVKTINNQDYDTNNVNDLLSDGQYNYIHRKKGKNEEYHNLTDNIKTISSDNTDLLTVTNYNKTTNTATLSPKHDAQKEQVLESTRDTITINHGTNGTDEKTTVDTNPEKVLEHENLSVGDGLSVSHSGNKSIIKIEPTFKEPGFNLDTVDSGVIHGTGFVSSVVQQPTTSETTFLTLKISNNKKFQLSVRPSLVQGDKAIIEYRFINAGVSTNWMLAPTSMNEINSLLSKKQDTLTAGDGITIQGKTIDTNPQKVLEHEKLKTGDGLSTSFNTDETTIMFKATKKTPETNLNTLDEGVIYGKGFSIDQVPSGNQDLSAAYVTINTSENTKVQFHIREQSLDYGTIRLYYRFIINGEVTEWRKMPGDRGDLDVELAQKQNKLTAMDGISITGDSIHLTTLNDYSEDLNNLTYTCTAKPIDNAPNLPTGVAGNGVLSVIRVGNVVSQTYHALDNNVYYRITNNSSSTFVWTPWVKVNTTAV